MDFILPLVQVFGGCCCNVFSFESLLADTADLRPQPDIGHVVTLVQFMLVSLVAVRPLLVRRKGLWVLRRPRIPLREHTVAVVIFFAVLILNNSVWRFGVSVPVHITLRLSATVVTMAVGYIFGGKLYTRRQVAALVMMLAGSALAVNGSGPAATAAASGNITSGWRFSVGVAFLVAALVLGALLGLYNENLYRKYGPHWEETFFFSHALALPLFAILGDGVAADLVNLWRAEPRYSLGVVSVLRPVGFIALNAVTQVVCARGVNQLAGRALSLTVAVALLVRKFVSLVLSAVVFGNRFSALGYLGSAILVAGTILYTMASYKKEKVA